MAPPSRVSTGPSQVITGPSQVITGPSPVGTGLFPPLDPAPPEAAENVASYEFDGRRAGRHRNGAPGVDVPSAGRHHRRARRRRTFPPRSGFGRPGRTLRVAVPVTVITLSVASGLIVSVNNDEHRTPPAFPFPPATLAGRDFTPYSAESTRGITLSEGRVASSGTEIVAVGAETGQRVPRAQFFVSLDDGRSWGLGTLSAAGGGTPAPGHAARFIAGGPGAWAAIGPDSVWTSADGRAWTLTSATGLPQLPGDQVTVLKRTGSGFIAAGTNTIAAGTNTPDGAEVTPVIFLSSDGTSWRRLGADRLRLAAGSGRALDIRLVAATGRLILIAGDVATPVTSGGSRHVTVRTGGAWLSDDGGSSWRAVTVPTGHGAQDQFSDAAATADGFLLVRPATVNGVRAADVYRSGNGTAWTFAATLTTPGGFTPGLMNGSSEGAVLVGQSGRTLTAFMSSDGARWRQAPALGSAAAETISGVAATKTGAVVAAGMSGSAFGVSQQLITVTGGSGSDGSGSGSGGVRNLSLAAIPGGVEPQLAVNAIAAQGSRQVAVGSANGFPAAWMSADGGRTWQRAADDALLARPGIQQLTGITHGSAGWLAVGGVTASAPEHPVVIGSADGSVWSAADGEPVFTGSGLFTEQAAAGRDGYVVVGWQLVTPTRTVAAAWWSAGLTGWQRAAGADGAAGAVAGAGGSSQMLAVTATMDGFLAVGSHGSRPAAWTTPDGRTWSQADLPLPTGATGAVLQHVAADGRTVVAAGVAQTSAGQVPFAARSADGGYTWTEAALPVPAGTAQVSALAAADGSFTVTGMFGVRPGEQDVVVWTSPDGTTWQAATPAGPGLSSPGIQAITGLTVSGRTLTGVGFTATPADEQLTLWQPPIG
ncbi:MAG: hypothetical protein ACLQB1_38290 [Streptosporangiaceae bacterium]